MTPFRERYLSFLAASYGVASPDELPVMQRLQVEDAYYAGLAVGFYFGFAADDDEAMGANKELQDFGSRIVDRYRDAGLPLGTRRS